MKNTKNKVFDELLEEFSSSLYDNNAQEEYIQLKIDEYRKKFEEAEND